MSSFETHEPREFEVSLESVNDWLTQSKGIVNHELLTAIEYMIYSDDDHDEVCALVINLDTTEIYDGEQKPATIIISVTTEHLDHTLESINKWSIESEEYEMCQRIKNLKQFVKEVGDST